MATAYPWAVAEGPEAEEVAPPEAPEKPWPLGLLTLLALLLLALPLVLAAASFGQEHRSARLVALVVAGLVPLALVVEGRVPVLEQHRHCAVAWCLGLLWLLVLDLEVLLGLVALGRQQVGPLQQIAGSAAHRRVLLPPRLPAPAAVQLHKPLLHVAHRLWAHQPIHW